MNRTTQICLFRPFCIPSVSWSRWKAWMWLFLSFLWFCRPSPPGGDPPLHRLHQNPPAGVNFLHMALRILGNGDRQVGRGRRRPALSPTEEPLSSFALVVSYQRRKVKLHPLHWVKSHPEIPRHPTSWVRLWVSGTNNNRRTRSRLSRVGLI